MLFQNLTEVTAEKDDGLGIPYVSELKIPSFLKNMQLSGLPSP